MIPNLEIQQRIAELRQKAKSPDGLTMEEMKEAITFLRAERLAMPQTKASASKSASKSTPNADDLLSELGL